MTQRREMFWMEPIGRIVREDKGVVLAIDAPYRSALEDLDQFSHVMVFWWADAFDNDTDRARLHIKPPYAPDRSIGVFATRSPFRPNPISMTTCPILGVDVAAGRVTVSDIDAFDGTRIVDLKAYLPVCDRVQAVRQPPWLDGWPEWMPENGTRLMDPKEPAGG
ncbi:MAG: SAM-dependent methyltransferase [Anaerolineae bacterium]|nr:SAM-dependent methyltransferase [Anaerolineae bacterium]